MILITICSRSSNLQPFCSVSIKRFHILTKFKHLWKSIFNFPPIFMKFFKPVLVAKGRSTISSHLALSKYYWFWLLQKCFTFQFSLEHHQLAENERKRSQTIFRYTLGYWRIIHEILCNRSIFKAILPVLLREYWSHILAKFLAYFFVCFMQRALFQAFRSWKMRNSRMETLFGTTC